MHQFIQQLIASLSLLNFVRRYKNRISSIKIKAAQAYVLGVKKTRVFFLGALFVALSCVLLTNGLSLVQAAFFTYSMWSNETKFVVALILGGIEFLGAAGILIYLFSEETWGKFSEINKVVNSVIENKSYEKKEK
jgi:hypothetical protein